MRSGFALEAPISESLTAARLAFVAGAVDGLGYYSSGFFSANMTGNVSLVSQQSALAHLRLLLPYVAIVVAFVVAAALTELCLGLGRRRGVHYLYSYGIATEGLLLTALGSATLGDFIPNHGLELVVGLAAAMGLQNSLSTSISGGRIRTTHLSGITTDIGIGLGALLSKVTSGEPACNVADLAKLKLHVLTLVAFCAGGVAGVIGFRACGVSFLFGLSAVLLRFSIPGLTLSIALHSRMEE